jgi:hypothetical protein
MPLNLGRRRSSTANDIVQSLRYAARDDVWSAWSDVAHTMIDLPDIVGTFDLQNVHVGWMKFSAGEPPDFLWDIAGVAQPRPSKDHRRGFSVHLLLDGFGLRELCANSGGLNAAISILFDQYENDPHAAQGLLPTVQSGQATMADSPFGSYWEPVFEITGWVPRPVELPVRRPPDPAPAMAASPAPTAQSGATAVATRDALDDDIPFATSDPAFEPAQKWQRIL